MGEQRHQKLTYLLPRVGVKLRDWADDADRLFAQLDWDACKLVAQQIGKPYWFIAKNDSRIVCLPCKVICHNVLVRIYYLFHYLHVILINLNILIGRFKYKLLRTNKHECLASYNRIICSRY